MLWLASADSPAPALPAAWLVATGANPRNLGERSALRHGIARRILARQLGCTEGDVALSHAPAGRPLIARPAAAGFHLSLATRSGVVAVALAGGPVGIDVERVDTAAMPPLDVLHPDERRALEAAGPALRPLAFARLWAAKEAYVKALGTGFGRPPESFAVSLPSEGRFHVSDPLRRVEADGQTRIIDNGGQDVLAAAAIVLD